LFIFMSCWWAINVFCYFILKNGSKRCPNSELFAYWKGIIKCLFFIQFNVLYFFLLLNGLCKELLLLCQQISTIFYGFWGKCDRQRLKTANFQNLKVFIFHPILMQFLIIVHLSR
jgi:hypothetical protein